MPMKLSVLTEAYERALALREWLGLRHASPDQVLGRVFEYGVEILEREVALERCAGSIDGSRSRLDELREQALVAEAGHAFLRQRVLLMDQERQRLEWSADELGAENRRLRVEVWAVRASLERLGTETRRQHRSGGRADHG